MLYFHPFYIMYPLSGLLMAGHETTANQITWIMVELARHPDVLQKGVTHRPFRSSFLKCTPVTVRSPLISTSLLPFPRIIS